MISVTSKYCRGCQRDLPRSAFAQKSNTHDGLRSRCRECENAASKIYRQQNPERVRANMARWQRENPEKRRANQKRITTARKSMIRAAKDRPCVDCGIQLPPEIMDLDHVRGEKLFDLSRAAAYSRLRIQAELDKCEVRCPNCHRLRHYHAKLEETI